MDAATLAPPAPDVRLPDPATGQIFAHVPAGGAADVDRAVAAARKLQAGTVWINTLGMNDPSAPFGGVKESGWGREVGEEGVLAYTETKTVTALLGA